MKNEISKMVSTIKHWWLLLILGILLLTGGFWVAVTPAESYVALAIVFTVLLIVSGIFQIIFSISNQKQLTGWGWYLSGGILEFLIGISLWSHPGMALGVLVFVVGFWLLFSGISIIAHSTDLKQDGVKGWGWILTFGILMTIISFFMIMDPVFGALNVVYLTSLAMIFMGVAYIMFSMKLKDIKSKYQDFDKEAQGDVNALKNNIMDSLKDVNPAIKNKISKMFDEYKK